MSKIHGTLMMEDPQRANPLLVQIGKQRPISLKKGFCLLFQLSAPLKVDQVF